MAKTLILTFRKALFISAIFLLAKKTNAQEIPVTVKVINQKQEPVAFATVTVTSRVDSLKNDQQVSDSTGKLVFHLVKGNQYLVSISSVNYQPLEKGISIAGNQNSFTFSLETNAKTLSGVVIKSSKPLMRQEEDKTIVDPENLVAASTNVYEVIEKTPGLFVDQDGNIYISSTTPALVQINGRDMKMSTADVATILKSLPPAAIVKIEIVRTPSAKYDASSSGGIVNVVLKKGVKIGMTGSANAGLQQGKYGNQFIGFNLNNNDGRKSSSLNLNYSHRNSYETIITDRLITPDTMLSQNAYTKYPANTYFGGYSVTFPAGKKWDNDFSTSISVNDFNNNTDNRNLINRVSTSQKLSDNLGTISNNGTSLNFRSGFNATMRIDSIGSEWANDVFFNYSKNKTEQDFSTYSYFPIDTVFGGDGINDNNRQQLNFQSDLRLKMKRRFTLESGAKASFLDFKSVANYNKDDAAGNPIKDPGRTNTFHYRENINAAYLQGTKTFGKDIVLKTGLRMENTNMEGNQIIPKDTSFNIHRTDFFPYIYLSKAIMKIAGYELRAYLVYRRTIVRPSYDQLNPFPRLVDQYMSETGNPSLRPQFTQNYEANISVDEKPLLAVGINDTKDIFTNVVYTSDSNHSYSIRTYDNLGKNKEWYLRGLGAIPPGKRYFFVIGAQYNHNFYQGLYENSPLSFKKGTWTFFTYHTFKIDKRSVITMNGFVRLKGQQQFYELGPFGALNSSINRKFMKDKLTVTVSVNDIFFTNNNKFNINQGSVDASGYREADTRRFGINLRYNFGIRKREEGSNPFNVESPAN